MKIIFLEKIYHICKILSMKGVSEIQAPTGSSTVEQTNSPIQQGKEDPSISSQSWKNNMSETHKLGGRNVKHLNKDQKQEYWKKKEENFPTLSTMQSFKKIKHLTHISHGKVPSKKRKAAIIRTMNKFRTEILNEKDKFTPQELREAKKSIFTLGRVYSLHNDRDVMPVLNKLSERLEAIELGQTDLDKGKKLGNGTINTVFEAEKNGQELVLKPRTFFEAEIQKDVIDNESGQITFGKRIYTFCDGSKIELEFHSFSKDDVDSVFNNTLENPELNLEKKYHRYIKQATKTLPNGAVGQIKFKRPDHYIPQNTWEKNIMTRNHLIMGEFYAASENFDEKLDSETHQRWPKESFRNNIKMISYTETSQDVAQSDYTGHRDVYGANKGTTVTERIFNEKRETPNDCVMVRTSGAVTKDGQENLAMDRAKGEDIFLQKSHLYYDKNSKMLKKEDVNSNLVDISPEERAKFADITSDASRIQLLDCVIGQLDRHPGNFVYDPQKGLIGIDHDIGFPVPEEREVANIVPNVMRNPNPKSPLQSVDGKSIRNFCMPPVVALKDAQAMLRMSGEELKQALMDETSLPESAIDAAVTRLGLVQTKLREMLSQPTFKISDSNIEFVGKRENMSRTNSYALQICLPAQLADRKVDSFVWKDSIMGKEEFS